MKFTELLEQIRIISDELSEYEDVELKLDMLEGETDYLEYMQWIFNRIEAESALQDNLSARADAIAKRKKSSKNRENSLRGLMKTILTATGEDKIKTPEFTVSLRRPADRVNVADDSFLPDELFIITKKPNLKAIKEALEAGESFQGVSMELSDQTITIRK